MELLGFDSPHCWPRALLPSSPTQLKFSTLVPPNSLSQLHAQFVILDSHLYVTTGAALHTLFVHVSHVLHPDVA